MNNITMYINRSYANQKGTLKHEEMLKLDISYGDINDNNEPEIFNSKAESTIEGRTRPLSFAETVVAFNEYKKQLYNAINIGFRHHSIDDIQVISSII